MPPKPETPDDRWQTAAHEAAHALADYLFLGKQHAFLSIREGVGSHGLAVGSVPDELRVDDVDSHLGGEVFLTDPRARGAYEATIVGGLAGDAAAEYVVPVSGFQPPPKDALRTAEALATVSPRHRELLLALESRLPSEVRTDEAAALEESRRLAGAEAKAHVEWLRQVARRFVTEHAPLIQAIAARLVADEVLSGDTFRRIVQEHKEPR